MSTQAPHTGNRELRVTVADEVYEQLQALVADEDVRPRSTLPGCSSAT